VSDHHEPPNARNRNDTFSTAWYSRMGDAMAVLDRLCAKGAPGGVEMQGLKMRLGVTDSMPTLVIVMALDGEGAPIVGFNEAMSPAEALIGAVNRIANGSMKWKEDQYGR
jgi:hypothetical protein